MKRLTINCISALRGGGQTNLINLMKYISQYKCKVILILNSNNINVFNKYKSEQTNIYEAKFASRSIFHRIYWEKFILPYKLKEWRTDIYYAPGGTMTTTVPNNCVSITTLQNMLPFDDIERRKFPFFSYIRFKLWMLKHILLKSFQKANKVVFVSRYSRDIVKSYISDIEKKSTMIPLAINNIFIDSKEMKKLPNSISRNKYYLYVSSLNYYKSHKELVISWKKLVEKGFNYPLVFVGPIVNRYGEEVLDLIKKLNLTNNVIYLNEIQYSKLPGLYKAARVLVFASACECCPNILLEMFASKKPILCSDKEPMPEFGEDSVMYFNPQSEDSFVNKVLEMENNPEIMKLYAEKSYCHSKLFNYENTIKKTINYILA